MACKYAKRTDEFHGWACDVSGGECMFLFPNSKLCAEVYGEGPDANQDKCEDCKSFYYENNKRCCLLRQLSDNGEPSKFIEDDVISCGAFINKNLR